MSFLLAPVYGISTAADSEAETFIEVNDKVDPGLKDAPIKPLPDNRIIQSSKMGKINNNTLKCISSVSRVILPFSKEQKRVAWSAFL